MAPRGIEGERLRKHVLRLEREIRALVAGGATGTLAELWATAAARLGTPEDQALEKVLAHTGESIKVEGDLVDCDHALPARLLTHAWRHAQERKAKRFRAQVDGLVRKLADILRAAFIHSEAGRRPESLKAAFGGPYRDAFDFAVMSRLIARGAPPDELPAARRDRIEWALAVLRSQRFVATPTVAAPPYEFRFDDCASAADAFRARLPEMIELVKAMSIAELEADGRYVESKDDAFFERFDDQALAPRDLALFPDYLVCIDPARADAPENAGLMQLLSSGLPVKVLVQTEDVLEETSIGAGHFAFGVRSVQLAATAMGLNDVFVLQTTSSNLYQLRRRIMHGLDYAGSALFSVFSGSPDDASALDPYLTAAAAMESRAFPAFTYDPSAGKGAAFRFSLEDNPQPELDWPIETFEYADETLQRVTESVAFTFADLAACDRRYARHFARVPRSQWNGGMIPVDEWLACAPGDLGDKVPYVAVVDGDDVLHRLIVDARLMQSARRCREAWHRLQEMGGIHNSHAERLLAREKAAWEAAKQRELEQLQAAAGTAAAAGSAGAEATAPAAAEIPAAEQRPSDDPWIETARCPSCNECQLINDRMFAYNDNKQAYIKDPDAGTFRQLVEAAESCQVAIIHPGKPRNSKEPGLEELMQRAAAFN
jgi:hypothetical protein